MHTCHDCTYLIETTDRVVRVVGNQPTCLAFYPAPIPDDILDGSMVHTTRHPSQHNDLVYRPQSHFKNSEK